MQSAEGDGGYYPPKLGGTTVVAPPSWSEIDFETASEFLRTSKVGELVGDALEGFVEDAKGNGQQLLEATFRYLFRECPDHANELLTKLCMQSVEAWDMRGIPQRGLLEIKKLGSGGFSRVTLVASVTRGNRSSESVEPVTEPKDPLLPPGRLLVRKLLFEGADARTVGRFKREQTLLKSLKNPVFPPFCMGGDQEYYMEYIPGHSLDEILREREFSYPFVASLTYILLRLVDDFHRAGYLHRDLKPQNIWIGTDGRVYLLDLGLAGYHDKAEESEQSANESELTRIQTHQTEFGGTPIYCAPEQFVLENAGAPADLYPIGVIGIQAFARQRFYDVVKNLSTLEAFTEGPGKLQNLVRKYPEDGTHYLPHVLQKVLLQLLNKEPEKRGTAAEVAEELLKAHSTLFPKAFHAGTAVPISELRLPMPAHRREKSEDSLADVTEIALNIPTSHAMAEVFETQCVESVQKRVHWWRTKWATAITLSSAVGISYIGLTRQGNDQNEENSTSDSHIELIDEPPLTLEFHEDDTEELSLQLGTNFSFPFPDKGHRMTLHNPDDNGEKCGVGFVVNPDSLSQIFEAPNLQATIGWIMKEANGKRACIAIGSEMLACLDGDSVTLFVRSPIRGLDVTKLPSSVSVLPYDDAFVSREFYETLSALPATPLPGTELSGMQWETPFDMPAAWSSTLANQPALWRQMYEEQLGVEQ